LGYQFPGRLRILIQKDDTTALAKKILDDRGSDSRCAASHQRHDTVKSGEFCERFHLIWFDRTHSWAKWLRRNLAFSIRVVRAIDLAKSFANDFQLSVSKHRHDRH
jgi:hypothetical protein